jgi:uncharacterized protein (TIGR02246 family)
MTEDQKNVIDTVKQMTRAFHESDMTGVLAAYEPNATVLFEPGIETTDRAEFEEKFGGFFQVSPTFTYSGHQAVVQGDIAVHFAPWTMKGKTPDGQGIEQSGLSVAILRKQADGKWLMVIDNPHGQHLLDQ